jgi:hypothetical protein
MRKLLVFCGFLLAALSSRASAQTYLVDLYHGSANKFTGSASSDFGVAGTVLAVGGSREETGTANTTSTYELGNSASLTLNAPSQGESATTGSSAADPLRLTGAYLFTTAQGSAPAVALTLTVPAGSSVSVAAIGSINGNPGTLSVSDGSTAQSAAVAPAGSSGTGAFTQVATFYSDAATTYTLRFSTTSGGPAEGDLSGLLITISEVLVTADSLLDTGKPGSVTYSAPGTSSGIAQIPSATNSSDLYWNLVPDPYGITSGSGTINIAYSGQGAIKSTVNLTGLDMDTVDAYPFIGYGADVFGYGIDGQAPQFPAKLSSMTSLVFDTSFTLSGAFTGNIDILFDEWLMPTATYSAGASGAVEVEILPYFSFVNSFFGTYIKTFTVPVTLNGAATTLSFDEYASAIGAGGGSLILFYPTQGLTSGELRFDALTFMNEAASTAAVDSDWLVAGFDLGTEFGQSATEAFTFTVNKLDIEQTIFTPPAVDESYSQYAASYGLTGTNATPAGNPEANGASNLLDYALNLNPVASGAPDLQAAVRTYGATSYLSIRFTRVPLATDITYIVESSPDLTAWTTVATGSDGGALTGPGVVTDNASSTVPHTVEVRDTVAATTASRRFLRLRVTLP